MFDGILKSFNLLLEILKVVPSFKVTKFPGNWNKLSGNLG